LAVPAMPGSEASAAVILAKVQRSSADVSADRPEHRSTSWPISRGSHSPAQKGTDLETCQLISFTA